MDYVSLQEIYAKKTVDLKTLTSLDIFRSESEASTNRKVVRFCQFYHRLRFVRAAKYLSTKNSGADMLPINMNDFLVKFENTMIKNEYSMKKQSEDELAEKFQR